MTSAPADGALARLRAEAAACRNCPLWRDATQTVFGEGPGDARLMFVGEQPGDSEDLDGRPFVGPAGKLFDRALTEAGLERKRVYVTNAVKHFKFEPRGKRRLHKKPDVSEIRACRLWLAAEIEAVEPALVVALGATALRSLTGRPEAVVANRAKILDASPRPGVFVTVHPSSLLRIPDPAARREAYAGFVSDLEAAGRHAAASGRHG